MKPLKLIALAALAVALLTSGCATSGMAKLAAQLKNDQATVVIRVRTVYGTIDFSRTNPGTNHTATVLPDGSITVGYPDRNATLVSADSLGIVTSAAVESAIKNSKK